MSVCVCVCAHTVLWGEERGLGARGVFGPRGHQLDGPYVLVSQLSQTRLSVLDHLLNGCVLVKGLGYLSLAETDKQNRNCDKEQQCCNCKNKFDSRAGEISNNRII